MKCPKCGYLGFEEVDRCRNCGYDFSLLPVVNLPELPLRDQQAGEVRPLEDLALFEVATPSAPRGGSRPATPDLERVISGPERTSDDLPLFGKAQEDAGPLITKASPPRPPLAVRRATPEPPRIRSSPTRAPLLDLAVDQDAAPGSVSQGGLGSRADLVPGAAGSEIAGVFARLMAATIDVAILVAVDLVVVYFTMKICGLDVADLGILPKVPLLAFLLVLNGGYLVLFTAAGQTLGKMAADIRVVSVRPDASLDFGRSLIRALVWLVLAVPAGLGFLTALSSRDRRGLHDRCAGTRVVRASL